MLISYLAILGFIVGIIIAKHTKDEKKAGFVYFKALSGTILAAFTGISLVYLFDLITVMRLIYLLLGLGFGYFILNNVYLALGSYLLIMHNFGLNYLYTGLTFLFGLGYPSLKTVNLRFFLICITMFFVPSVALLYLPLEFVLFFFFGTALGAFRKWYTQ